MPVTIGTVTTFPHPKADKEQAVKILEECAEVLEEVKKAKLSPFTLWKLSNGDIEHASISEKLGRKRIIEECADVIQATCNLLAALGVDDMRGAMAACEERNRERGRL